MSGQSEQPPTILESTTAAIADVSPAWAAVVDPVARCGDDLVDRLGRDRARGVELIREGWLVHRGASRVIDGASPDLALLIGDWCYAAGLCSITDHGTLDDVSRLAALVADVSVRAGDPIDELAGTWNDALEAMHDG